MPGPLISDSLTMNYSVDLQILWQSVVALVLGGLLGWERESAGKWAGLRTHMLVCLASFLFLRLGLLLIADSATEFAPAVMRADPTRLIEAVAVGISFIGGGTILRSEEGERMRGLTTAASLLATGSIGIAVAIQHYVAAVGISLIGLFILRAMHWLEPRIGHPS